MIFLLKNETVRDNLINTIKTLIYGKEVAIRDGRRSLDQNAYYWTIVEIIADYMGTHKDDMHRYLAVRILGPEEFIVGGKSYYGPRSTRKLSKREFAAYVDEVLIIAVKLGLQIPTRQFFGG